MQHPFSDSVFAQRVSEVFAGFTGKPFSVVRGREGAGGSDRIGNDRDSDGSAYIESRGRHLSQGFALHHRPGSLVVVDDVPDYLEVLAESLTRDWHVEKFGSGSECINYLQQEPPLWEADFWAQQQILERWHGGQRLIPQILKYWAATPDRYRLTKVCVVDYLMPGLDGMDVLEELHEWPGCRVLLTGAYDTSMAIEAFNRGAIDQFLPKQEDNFGQKLRSVISTLMERPNARYHQIWSSTLTLMQRHLLRQSDIVLDLNRLVSRTFEEWIVIGDPFGVLGIDRSGRVLWLQLEPTEQLPLLAEMSSICGGTVDQAALILDGKALSEVQLRRNLGVRSTPRTVPAFAIGTTGRLLAAVHQLDTDAGVAPLGYVAWRATVERGETIHSA